MTPAGSVLRLAPGSGLIARRSTVLLFAKLADSVLVDAFATSAPGNEMQALASATVATGFEVGPYVCLAWDDGLRVMAYGDIAVETDQPSLPMLSGAGSRTWVEHTVPLTTGRAIVEVAGEDTHPVTDLVDGTVLAGAFRLELGAATPAAAPLTKPAEPVSDRTAAVPRVDQQPAPTPPEPAPEPAPGSSPATRLDQPAIDPEDPVAALAAIQAAAVEADGEPVVAMGVAADAPVEASVADDQSRDHDVTVPPPVSEELMAEVRDVDATDARSSLVDAKLCPGGHANPPTAATCAVCGEFLSPGSRPVVEVPRPSLGRLRLDDGEVVELDEELLLGRNPDRDADPSRAALRRVTTGGDKVSRSHLEVRFQGWDVLVADCGSTNGTFVLPHPGGQVGGVEPGRAQMVEPGAVVYFGSRSFTVIGRDE